MAILGGKNAPNALGARATCPSASLRGALWLSVIVALVSLMFVTLDNIVTLADAGGILTWEAGQGFSLR